MKISLKICGIQHLIFVPKKCRLLWGRSKMTSPGGGGRGSDKSVTNGDKGGREVLASDDVFYLNISFCILLKDISQ